jgi:hypothetical protein
MSVKKEENMYESAVAILHLGYALISKKESPYETQLINTALDMNTRTGKASLISRTKQNSPDV